MIFSFLVFEENTQEESVEKVSEEASSGTCRVTQKEDEGFDNEMGLYTQQVDDNNINE